MGALQEWKKKAVAPDQQQAQSQQVVRRQIAAAAGAEYFQNRDPVYHVTEDFQKTFDLMGTRKAAQRAGELFSTHMKEITPGVSGLNEEEHGKQMPGSGRSTASQEEIAQKRARASFLEQSSMDQMVDPAADEGDRMFLTKFSQIAFQRGTLAAAVLRGTGKMMLFSCLKRTVGQSGPTNPRQRMLFEASSQRRAESGDLPEQVMFNRGQANSAVGLVVDVLNDARRTVDTMVDMAGGKSVPPAGSGAETLSRMYPFLSVGKEQALLAQYRIKLQDANDVSSKEILKHAMEKTQALVQKKEQMKLRFITALRSVSDSASAALEIFTMPGFAQELVEMQQEMVLPELPPPDDPKKDDEEQREDRPR